MTSVGSPFNPILIFGAFVIIVVTLAQMIGERREKYNRTTYSPTEKRTFFSIVVIGLCIMGIVVVYLYTIGVLVMTPELSSRTSMTVSLFLLSVPPSIYTFIVAGGKKKSETPTSDISQ